MLYVNVTSPRAQRTIEKLRSGETLLSLWLYVRVTPFGLKKPSKVRVRHRSFFMLSSCAFKYMITFQFGVLHC